MNVALCIPLYLCREREHRFCMFVFCWQGFCLPAEYSDEAGGEGATDFVDVEGGGFGEGEGAKDVSEQIESQEQVWGQNSSVGSAFGLLSCMMQHRGFDPLGFR